MFRLLTALTRDGSWLQFAATAPRLFVAKMKALGLGWMLEDEAWKGVPVLEDADQRLELWERMLAAVNEKSLAEWEAVFDSDPNVFVEQYRRGAEVLDHPQLLHDGRVIVVADAERGPVRQPAAIVAASVTPADPTRSAPLLDEHRVDIVAELAAASAAAPIPDAAVDRPRRRRGSCPSPASRFSSWRPSSLLRRRRCCLPISAREL